MAAADGAIGCTTVDDGGTLEGVVAAYGVSYEPEETVTHPCRCAISVNGRGTHLGGGRRRGRTDDNDDIRR